MMLAVFFGIKHKIAVKKMKRIKRKRLPTRFIFGKYQKIAKRYESGSLYYPRKNMYKLDCNKRSYKFIRFWKKKFDRQHKDQIALQKSRLWYSTKATRAIKPRLDKLVLA